MEIVGNNAEAPQMHAGIPALHTEQIPNNMHGKRM